MKKHNITAVRKSDGKVIPMGFDSKKAMDYFVNHNYIKYTFTKA